MMCLLVYRPVSDTDRVRVREHPAALLIRNPNPATRECLRTCMIQSASNPVGAITNVDGGDVDPLKGAGRGEGVAATGRLLQRSRRARS